MKSLRSVLPIFACRDPARLRTALRFVGSLFVLLAVTFVQMGCALSIARPPDSEIASPASYRAANPQKNGIRPAPDWWRSFGSPELDALVDRAIAANYNIAAAVARIEQADAQVRINAALLLPSGGLSASKTEARTSAADVPTGPFGPAPPNPSTHIWDAGISASYQVDFWGQNAALVLAAEKDALASEFNRDVVRLTVASSVVNTYVQILSSEDQLRIARENVRLAMRIQAIIRQRVDAGTSTTLDLLQQDYIVAQQRATVPALVQSVRQNIFALATLLGELPENIVISGHTLADLSVPEIAPGLPSELLLQRPDVRSAQATLAASAANLASARVALLPNVALTGQRGYESMALSTLITPPAIVFEAVQTVSQPVFDIPKLLGQVDLQKGLEKEQLADYRQTIIQAFTDVEQALVAVRETTEQERLARISAGITRHGYQLLLQEMNAGNIDLTTMLNTQTTLFVALDGLVTAQQARLQAAVSLYQALGGGWSVDPASSEAQQGVMASISAALTPVTPAASN